MFLQATVLSVNVGLPQDLGRPGTEEEVYDRPWRSGIYKTPVVGPIWVGPTNLAGDGQGDTRIHGGPDRAVHAYPSEHYPYWREQLDEPDLAYADFGENLTTAGLLESTVCVGDTLEVGGALLQVTQPRLPCWKLARRFRRKDMAVQLRVAGRVGWHMRTLREGNVEAGQELRLVERPAPEWPLDRVFQILINARREREAALELARCPYLSAYQRRALGDPDAVPARVETEA